MSKRKRKSRRQHSRRGGFVFPTPLAVILLTLAGLALSYLWLCGRCEAAGRRIKQYEATRTELRKRRMNEEFKWANMKSPRNIEAALRRHHLVMDWPSRSRLRELSLTEHEPPARVFAQRRQSYPKMRIVMND